MRAIMQSTYRFASSAALLLALVAAPALGLAQDAARAKAGLEVWKSAGCADCHGAFADGDKQRDESPTGANLRTTKLDDAALTETIRCGRPNTGMPRFDEGSYMQRGCNGNATGPVPDGLYPTPRMLSADEIGALVVYLRTRVVGRRKVTPEECAEYYGDMADSFCGDDK
jgi:mono/diheme cytochrome c family protein